MGDAFQEPLWRQVLSGAQMLFVAFGALVLMPLITGLDPNVALFTAGLGTLLFQLVTGRQVPVFLASSFAFITPIILAKGQFGLAATMGGVVAAGFVYTFMGLAVKIKGTGFIDKLLPPVVIGPVTVEKISGKKITVVPILRAGIGMLDGVLSLIPGAKVSAVGVARNEETLEARTYLEKLAPDIAERRSLIIDPMLATGGSMVATIDLLKKAGCKEIRAMVLVAAPEGIQKVEDAHPVAKNVVAKSKVKGKVS